MKKGLMCILFGHFGVHNFIDKKIIKGILNILITVIIFLGMLLSIVLLPYAVETGAYAKNLQEKQQASYAEANLPAKIFDERTGYLDGYKTYTDIDYDEINETPHKFRKELVVDLNIYDGFTNESNIQGTGGYLELLSAPTNKYFKTNYFNVDASDDCKLEINYFKDQTDRKFEKAYIELHVDIKSNGKTILLEKRTDDHQSNIYNLSDLLKNNGYSNEDISLRYVIDSSIKTKSVVFESIKITNKQNSIDPNLSFEDGSKWQWNENNAWTTNASHELYKVKVKKCDFKYDIYEDLYGERYKTYAFAEFKELKQKKICTFSEDDIVNTFEVLDHEKCPIIEVTKVNSLSFDKSTILFVECKVKGYMLYSMSETELTPKYTEPPKFIMGTNSDGMDIFAFVLGDIAKYVLISSLVLLALSFMLFVVRVIFFIVKGLKIIISIEKEKKKNVEDDDFEETDDTDDSKVKKVLARGFTRLFLGTLGVDCFISGDVSKGIITIIITIILFSLQLLILPLRAVPNYGELLYNIAYFILYIIVFIRNSYFTITALRIFSENNKMTHTKKIVVGLVKMFYGIYGADHIIMGNYYKGIKEFITTTILLFLTILLAPLAIFGFYGVIAYLLYVLIIVIVFTVKSILYLVRGIKILTDDPEDVESYYYDIA